MSTVITAGNATNGLSFTADNAGTFDFKTGTGAGTTAMTIDASQVVTMPGTLAVTGAQTIGGNLTVTGTITGTGGVSGGLGTGQTWQTFTIGSTRISGTTYTNSTGKPIAVLATSTTAPTMVVGGVTIPNQTVSGTTISSAFIVPPGLTYAITATLSAWAELR